jgi:hypothetical protein
MNQPPTTFTKADICLGQQLEHELHAKMAFFYARSTIHNNFDHKFETLPLKIWNATNYESCVPRKGEQLLYWPILSV